MRPYRVMVAVCSVLIICNSISACALPASSLPGIQLEIFAPNDGAILPLEAINVYAVAADSSDPYLVGVGSGYEFYANGIKIGEDDSFAAGGVAAIVWTPTEPGEYFIQFFARVDRRSGFSEAVRVCVIDLTLSPTLTDSYGYDGSCVQSARHEFAAPGPISMSATAMPARLAFEPSNRFPPISCPAFSNPAITFRATVLDTPDDVEYVVVEYRVPEGGDPDTLGSQTIILNRTGGVYPEELYVGTTEELNVFINRGGTDAGELTWTARGYGRDGSLLLTDGPYAIPFVACGSPPATPTVSAVSVSPTPASEADCPPGTYFAPATNRCIAIEIPSPKPDGKSCGEYGTLAACTAAGCTWDGQTQSCK